MPKISVHLEADTAEEFASLLLVFHVKHLEDIVYQREREDEADLLTKQAVSDVLYAQPKKPEPVSTRTVEETPEPVTVRVPEPAAEAPVKSKRGRPFKTAPVEPAEAAQPAVTPQPVPAVEEPVPAVVKAAPAPKVKEPTIESVASRQDLLDVFSEYVQRYGASFGFSDISQLLQKHLGDGVRKASDVTEDKLSVAIGAIKTAIADNPFNRKRDYA
jgi:outer membrane biosynthesis protein TonB